MSLIPAGRRIDAVLFDMDGTLIRSEDRTEDSSFDSAGDATDAENLDSPVDGADATA